MLFILIHFTRSMVQPLSSVLLLIFIHCAHIACYISRNLFYSFLYKILKKHGTLFSSVSYIHSATLYSTSIRHLSVQFCFFILILCTYGSWYNSQYSLFAFILCLRRIVHFSVQFCRSSCYTVLMQHGALLGLALLFIITHCAHLECYTFQFSYVTLCSSSLVCLSVQLCSSCWYTIPT
jgi:hypothetical protein